MLDTVSSLAGIDVRTDEWGVDLNMTGSQKCLAAPLGMALVSVSPAAWEAMERRKHKADSWAYDLLRWKENWVPVSRGGQVPDGTPAPAAGLDPDPPHPRPGRGRPAHPRGRARRIASAATPSAGRAFRAGLDAMRLEMFPDASLLSNTVSCFKTPAGIDPAAVVTHMRDHYGILIGTGLDKMRTTTLRVGHMGITASPHVRAADALRARADAARSRLQDRGGRGRGRGPGALRRGRGMIVVPDDFPSVFEGSAAHERAKKLGAVRVFTERGADDEQELIRRIGRAQVAINIRAHARFSDAVFAACPALKMVSVWGTGTDNIDLNAAGMRGVTVCNTPGINAFAVAEHALTLMLAVARKITLLDAEMRAGKWPREMLTQLLGKTLGVFGMGTIGARVAALGRGIGMNVLGWSAQGDDKRASARRASRRPPRRRS